MPGLWHCLEDIPGPVALPSAWRAFTGERFDTFKALCLQERSKLPNFLPCHKEPGCAHAVIQRSDGAIEGFCKHDRPTCPPLQLSRAEIIPLELSWPRLARALCRALALDNKFTKLDLQSTVQIGSWSADSIPVILTIQYDRLMFRSVIAELATTLNQPFILFAPTSRLLDAHAQQLLARPKAAFFPLDPNLTLNPDATIISKNPPAQLFARFAPERSTLSPLPSAAVRPTPRYMIRKGLGVWKLIFDGKEADLKHERGIFYVAYLLTHPPEQPIHALDLLARIPEMYRHQLGLEQLTDPTTGRVTPVQSHARIQERSLSLDDAQTMRAILRKEKELEAILDSESESEPVKAEALRELEELAQFQKQYGRRTHDNSQRAVDSVRKAIARFHQRLLHGADARAALNDVHGLFASHINQYLLIPSRRYSGLARHRARTSLAGCLTYERPPGITWES
jgi:hypothetical protein